MLEEHLAETPDSGVTVYNLACALARAGQARRGARAAPPGGDAWRTASSSWRRRTTTSRRSATTRRSLARSRAHGDAWGSTSRARRSSRSGGGPAPSTSAFHRGPASLARAARAGFQDSVPRSALHSLHARVERMLARCVGGSVARPGLGPALHDVRRPGGRPRAVHARPTAGRRPHPTKGRGPRGAAARPPRRSPDRRGRGGRRARRQPERPPLRGADRHRADPLGRRAPADRLDRTASRGRSPRTPASSWHGATCTPSAPARREASPPGPASARVPRSPRSTRSATSLVPVRTPIGDAFVLASDEALLRAPDGAPAPARLLPSGDLFYLLQGADRELLVPDPGQRASLWTSRVWPGAVLVDGDLAGTWRRAGAPRHRRRRGAGSRGENASRSRRRPATCRFRRCTARSRSAGRPADRPGGAPQARTRRPAAVGRPRAPGSLAPGSCSGRAASTNAPCSGPASAATSSSTPAASANALCACVPPNGTSSSGRAAPVRTSPCVTAPIETSATTGRPSEDGIAIAIGFVPVSARAAVRVRQTPR